MEQGGDFYERENKTLEATGCCLSCGAVGTWQYFYSQDRDRGGLRRKEKGKGCDDSCAEKKDSSKEKNIGSYVPESFVCRTAKHSICADHAFRRREASSG